MKLATFRQGESITLGFTFPLTYSLTRIEEIKCYIGSKLIANTRTDTVVRCELKSEDTKSLYGDYKVIFWLDDAEFGVKKIYVGDVSFNSTGASAFNQSINDGFDVLVNLAITETAITVDNVLYNYFKGDKGDAGNLASVTASVDANVGTPEVVVTYAGENADFAFKNLKGSNGADGNNGTDGTDGKTAYQSAVDAGYAGTELQFNADLVTVSAKQDKTDNGLETTDKTVVGAINEVNSKAGGANQAVVAADYPDLITAMLDTNLQVGQNLLIVKIDVPDMWIKTVFTESVIPPYFYVDDATFIADVLSGAQIGYYELALLETGKVDLTNFYTKIETDTQISDYSEPKNANIQEHISAIGNPHGLTLSDIGAAPERVGDENYVTDTEKSNLHAPNSDNETASTIGTIIEAQTETAAVVDATKFAVSNTLLGWVGGLKIYTYLKGKYDLLYGSLATINTWALLQTFTSGLKTTKIIPNSDTTGVVIRNAADTADVVKVDTGNATLNVKKIDIYPDSNSVIFKVRNFGADSYCSIDFYNTSNFQVAGFGYGNAGVGTSFADRFYLYTNNKDILFSTNSVNSIRAFISQSTGNFGIGNNFKTPETTLDVNGSTTHRDYVYLNSTGTRTTGDIVGDRRRKVILGIETTEICTVANTTKGSGTWVVQSKVLADKSHQFGNDTDNTTIEADGTIKFNGAATVWGDIDFPIVIRTTGANIPTMATFNGNLQMPQWAVNDFVQCESQEFVHEWKEGSTCYFHLHLNTNGLDATDRFVKFEIEYAYSVNGVWTFPAVVTTADITIPANTASKTQLIMSLFNFTPTGAKIGDHCIARLKRVAATGTAPTGNPFIPMLQMHVEKDMFGSRTMISKL